jgi:hypothetical protein
MDWSNGALGQAQDLNKGNTGDLTQEPQWANLLIGVGFLLSTRERQ